jgi:hypothetical protein
MPKAKHAEPYDLIRDPDFVIAQSRLLDASQALFDAAVGGKPGKIEVALFAIASAERELKRVAARLKRARAAKGSKEERRAHARSAVRNLLHARSDVQNLLKEDAYLKGVMERK